jgi:site-specific DNA recombinase
MRTVIYTRYSTDKQSEMSTADQVRLCQARCDLLSVDVVAIHSDEGVSGALPVASRPAGKKLLADALAKRFDLLVIESFDRAFRDLVEQEQIVRRFEFRDIRIIAITDGYDSGSSTSKTMRKIPRIIRGLANEMQLDDIGIKTHRGLSGKATSGHHTGGMSFGYKSVQNGTGKTLEVVESQAQTVRQIFEWYGRENWSVEKIAHRLNELRKESPRGKAWGKSVIYGNPKKGSGILNNPLYDGRVIWNRGQWLKDPDTGLRQRVERPESEWIKRDEPALRIVEPDLWKAAETRMNSTRLGKVYLHSKPTLFGGLLRCSLCDGPLTAINQTRYGCKNAKEHGRTICKGVLVSRQGTDEKLLATVREELLSPSAIIEFQRAYKELSSSYGAEKSKADQRTRARLGEIASEVRNLVQALSAIGTSPALTDRLRELETEKSTLSTPRPEAPPKAAEFSQAKLKAIVYGLDVALKKDVKTAKPLLEELFGKIRIVAEADGLYAEFGSLRTHLLLAAAGEIQLVAGAGFELDLRRVKL